MHSLHVWEKGGQRFINMVVVVGFEVLFGDEPDRLLLLLLLLLGHGLEELRPRKHLASRRRPRSSNLHRSSLRRLPLLLRVQQRRRGHGLGRRHGRRGGSSSRRCSCAISARMAASIRLAAPAPLPASPHHGVHVRPARGIGGAAHRASTPAAAGPPRPRFARRCGRAWTSCATASGRSSRGRSCSTPGAAAGCDHKPCTAFSVAGWCSVAAAESRHNHQVTWSHCTPLRSGAARSSASDTALERQLGLEQLPFIRQSVD